MRSLSPPIFTGMEQEANNQLSQPLQDGIRYFLQDADVTRMSRSLRKVFFEYLRYTSDGPDLQFNEIVTDVENMFELLDKLGSEKVK